MAGRRREVVLLGAWFLIAPPLPEGKRPEPHAPVSSWTRVRSFDTAMHCEETRLASGAAARAVKDLGAAELADMSRCLHADRLRAMGALLAVTRPANVFRVAPTAYDAMIREAADRNELEYALVKAVIRAESDFDHLAISPKGARGLMQLMPATAAEHLVRNVFLPRENIEAGCRHLRELLDRYGFDVERAVAAYNAGARRVDEWGGVPPIPETREYLERVLRYRIAYLREGAGSGPGARPRPGGS
ncbi:MAG TPA: lytic transglycosylase domain-containing protein [Candidatus Binatus sp.]|nr:lytic transglycosylase domain-containing protein [Candidatus Binatus sp.]